VPVQVVNEKTLPGMLPHPLQHFSTSCFIGKMMAEKEEKITSCCRETVL
jgi:hypothetical protein